MIIRPYEEKDRESVRFICLNSNGPCKSSGKEINYLLATYCDYYIEEEGINGFVAADENDNAVGYILCAENYDNFCKVFRRKYLTKISRRDMKHWLYAALSDFFQRKYKKIYPAHLHIDILPQYQRMGLGHMLMDALCQNLKSKGISGVCLTAGVKNEKGRNFYEKYGFTLLEEMPVAAVYALKICCETNRSEYP